MFTGSYSCFFFSSINVFNFFIKVHENSEWKCDSKEREETRRESDKKREMSTDSDEKRESDETQG